MRDNCDALPAAVSRLSFKLICRFTLYSALKFALNETVHDNRESQQRSNLAVTSETGEDRFLRLRTVVVTAALIGAVASVGFLLRTTSRNPSQLLIVLMAIWVASPFVAMMLASFTAKRWSTLTRMTLYSVVLIVTLSSLAIYVADALWPRSSQGAFVFIVVPPASWLFSVIVIAMVALILGRRSRPAHGV